MLLLSCLPSPQSGRADEPRFNETELKAAYLYNFAYFVTWPTANKAFQFCSYANSPVTGILAKLIEGERVNDLPIQLIIDPIPEQLHECQVIYIPAQQERILAATLEFVRPFPVLTVSDIADFEHRGGMIRLANDGLRVQPVIQLKNVTRIGLAISSKLLRSSRLIE
ncbi:YfiR family protein [Methylomonas sp. MO1]|uniref:YfiR family protein n=1 Tax=unclassified Methylomonas TaxID=2608980 RepID=UPI00047BAB15|nr:MULTISPECIES: YfiR family protein [unclassified Methylomonas]MDT4289350.1 YfiR family protein [Methylomonas sp. MO1]